MPFRKSGFDWERWLEESRSRNQPEGLSLFDFSLLWKPSWSTLDPRTLLGCLVADSNRPWLDSIPNGVDEVWEDGDYYISRGTLTINENINKTFNLVDAWIGFGSKSDRIIGRSELLHNFHQKDVSLNVLESTTATLEKLGKDPGIRQRVANWLESVGKPDSRIPNIGIVTGILVKTKVSGSKTFGHHHFLSGHRRIRNLSQNKFAIRTEHIPIDYLKDFAQARLLAGNIKRDIPLQRTPSSEVSGTKFSRLADADHDKGNSQEIHPKAVRASLPLDSDRQQSMIQQLDRYTGTPPQLAATKADPVSSNKVLPIQHGFSTSQKVPTEKQRETFLSPSDTSFEDEHLDDEPPVISSLESPSPKHRGTGVAYPVIPTSAMQSPFVNRTKGVVRREQIESSPGSDRSLGEGSKGKFRESTISDFRDNGLDALPWVRNKNSLHTQRKPNMQTRRYMCKWELPEFIKRQFEPGQSLSKAVTLTGGEAAAQATTCAEYVSYFWPKGGPDLLKEIDKMLLFNYTFNSTLDRYGQGNHVNIRSEADRGTVVSVTADSHYYQDEVANTLRWLAATFRSSPYYSIAKSNASYQLIQGELHLLLDELNSVLTPEMCWHSLFPHALLAVDFPASPRIDGVGLAIAPKLMAYLAGIIMPVEYHDGLILKGLSTTLIPIRECDCGEAIQWHLFPTEPSDGSFDLRAFKGGAEDKEFLKVKDPATLFQKKAYLGWCKEAKVLLGSNDSNYAAVNWSGPAPERSRLTFSGFSLGLSSSGMGAFGPSATANFVVAKNQRARFMDIEQQLIDRLKLSISKPALIYDTTTQRAWLVPFTSLLLHMMHLRYRELTKNSMSASPDLMPYSQTVGEGGYEAYRVLVTHLQPGSKSALGSSATWRDTLAVLCTALDMALKDAREVKDKVSVNEESEIYGFELLNVVRADSPFRFSERKVQKQSGGWASIAQQIGYVLFCSDLGDALVPSPNATHLCERWMTVPPSHDYLSAYVPCVQEVLEQQGKHTVVQMLQNQAYEQSLYEECVHKDGRRCSHLKTYDALLKSPKEAFLTTPAITIEKNSNPRSRGALIFGKYTKLSRKTVPITAESNYNGATAKPRVGFFRRRFSSRHFRRSEIAALPSRHRTKLESAECIDQVSTIGHKE